MSYEDCSFRRSFGLAPVEQVVRMSRLWTVSTPSGPQIITAYIPVFCSNNNSEWAHECSVEKWNFKIFNSHNQYENKKYPANKLKKEDFKVRVNYQRRSYKG